MGRIRGSSTRAIKHFKHRILNKTSKVVKHLLPCYNNNNMKTYTKRKEINDEQYGILKVTAKEKNISLNGYTYNGGYNRVYINRIVLVGVNFEELKKELSKQPKY